MQQLNQQRSEKIIRCLQAGRTMYVRYNFLMGSTTYTFCFIPIYNKKSNIYLDCYFYNRSAWSTITLPWEGPGRIPITDITFWDNNFSTTILQPNDPHLQKIPLCFVPKH